MPTIRLDLRRFSSEDRLYRTLFEDETFLQWAKGDYDLHLYIDSLDECLLRIDSVAALLADEIPKISTGPAEAADCLPHGRHGRLCWKRH